MSDDVLKKMGVRIAALRQSRGIAPEAICDSLGITRRMLTRFESGSSEPSLPQLADLACVLGVRVGVLMGSEPFDGFADQGGTQQ